MGFFCVCSYCLALAAAHALDLGEVPAAGSRNALDRKHCDAQAEANSLPEVDAVKLQAVSRQKLIQVKLQAVSRLKFIHAPKMMDLSRRIDTTAMIRSTMNGNLIVYTDESAEDNFVSATIHRGHAWEKGYVTDFCEEFKKLDKKADFLDLGSNIGTWSIPMAECLNKLQHSGKVIAIEAMPQIALHMAASIQANKFEDNISLFNYALSDSNETKDSLPEYISPTNKGRSSLMIPKRAKDDPNSLVNVAITTLDRILQESQPQVFAMKMDVEGFEGHVILGSDSFFTDPRTAPCLLQIELKDKIALPGKGDMKTWVLKYLQENGYSVEDLGVENYRFRRLDDCVNRFMTKH